MHTFMGGLVLWNVEYMLFESTADHGTLWDDTYDSTAWHRTARHGAAQHSAGKARLTEPPPSPQGPPGGAKGPPRVPGARKWIPRDSTDWHDFSGTDFRAAQSFRHGLACGTDRHGPAWTSTDRTVCHRPNPPEFSQIFRVAHGPTGHSESLVPLGDLLPSFGPFWPPWAPFDVHTRTHIHTRTPKNC